MSSSTSRSLVPMANRELSIKPASHVTATSSLNEIITSSLHEKM